MNMRELMPDQNRMPVGRREIPGRRNEEIEPLWTLHREVNRLFDDVFRGSFHDRDAERFGSHQAITWPNVEIAKTGKEIKVTAELPGVDEKDVRVELSNNVLTIDGEKRSEIEDQNRWFSERYYGHFERRIPLNWEVDEDRAAASFRNGVLTITLPKSPKAQDHTKRIPVTNGG
jgi:HSP20 family protein